MGEDDWTMMRLKNFFKKYGFTYWDLAFIVFIIDVYVWGTILINSFGV